MINQWIDAHKQREYKRVLIILDKCPIYRSKSAIEYMKSTTSVYMFLPYYTPSLASIELAFANLKR